VKSVIPELSNTLLCNKTSIFPATMVGLLLQGDAVGEGDLERDAIAGDEGAYSWNGPGRQDGKERKMATNDTRIDVCRSIESIVTVRGPSSSGMESFVVKDKWLKQASSI